jgi:hypothetical protein
VKDSCLPAPLLFWRAAIALGGVRTHISVKRPDTRSSPARVSPQGDTPGATKREGPQAPRSRKGMFSAGSNEENRRDRRAGRRVLRRGRTSGVGCHSRSAARREEEAPLVVVSHLWRIAPPEYRGGVEDSRDRLDDEVCMHMKRISTIAHLYSAPQDVGFRVGYRTGAKRPSPGPMGVVYAGCWI